jgi:hypothetical protein
MDEKSGSGSGMNNQDHIYESLETIFWVNILEFCDADSGPGWKKIGSGMEKNLDPGWKKFGSRIQDKLPRSATLCGIAIIMHGYGYGFRIQHCL